MCGIAGILRFDDRPIERDQLERMAAYVRHRGPDDQGILIDGRCGFAHTRLSVIDLTGGAQPMRTGHCPTCVGLSVVFNGEIYNHRELRRELESLGHRFTSDHCDTEVLLHGFRAWGTALPRRLVGMFAFAVWDAMEARLFFARDRAGKKPLYIRHAADELAFASLIGAVRHNDSADIDRDAMLDFLRRGYTRHQSFVADVEELPPGTWLSVDGQGQLTSERYWSPNTKTSTPTGDPLTQVRNAITQAVECRLKSDVPLGCFLSGGIDSSVVAALAQRALRERGARPLRTFSVQMPDEEYDESPYARAVAEHIGSQHVELTAAPGADLVAELSQLTAIWGEPIADSSVLPTFWLARAAREHITVALSGDGGDELFGGYDRYRAMRLLERHGGWLRRVPRSLLDSAEPRSRRARLARLAAAAEGDTPAHRYQSMIHLFNEPQLRALGLDAPAAQRHEPAPDWPNDPDTVSAAMRWDMAHYLPCDVLRKVDRASMAVALEVRCPLLDHRVMDLAASLPLNVLMPHGRPKGLLRHLCATLVPPAIARRPKRGFAIPIGRWLRTTMHQSLADRLFDGSLAAIGLNTTFIETLYREHVEKNADHAHRLFALLTLSLWQAWRKAGMPATIPT